MLFKLHPMLRIFLLAFLIIPSMAACQAENHNRTAQAKETRASDCGEHPTNVNWQELHAHYAACTQYITRREDAQTITEFISYLQYDDDDNSRVKEAECRMVQAYYRRLKFCSRSHTVDSDQCDELMETLAEAKVLLRHKRFSLEE